VYPLTYIYGTALSIVINGFTNGARSSVLWLLSSVTWHW